MTSPMTSPMISPKVTPRISPWARCLFLAILFTGLGLGLRLSLTPLPVDGAFRDVLRSYGAPVSNTSETSRP